MIYRFCDRRVVCLSLCWSNASSLLHMFLFFSYPVPPQEQCFQLAPHVPVIFLSARIQAEDRIKGYQAGGHDYMVKPFDHEELIAKVKKTIQTVVGAQHEKNELNEQIKETNDIVLQSMENKSIVFAIIIIIKSICTAWEIGRISVAG